MNSNQTDHSSAQKRVRLPEPDNDNITVLTRELPNSPILPWHRYDSPWLQSDLPADLEGMENPPTDVEETAANTTPEAGNGVDPMGVEAPDSAPPASIPFSDRDQRQSPTHDASAEVVMPSPDSEHEAA